MRETPHALDSGEVTPALERAREAHIKDGQRRYVVRKSGKIVVTKTLPKTVGRYWMVASGNLSMHVPDWAKAD
jgi:hypothetical protein